MNDTRRLTELLERKRACLEQARDLGRQQCLLAEGGALSDLLQLLTVKQAVLDALQRIERELDPFRAEDPERRAWPTPADRAAAARVAAECESLLGEIMTQEQSSERQLRLRRDEAAEQLAGAHTADVARHAYGAQADVARQLDLSSDF